MSGAWHLRKQLHIPNSGIKIRPSEEDQWQAHPIGKDDSLRGNRQPGHGPPIGQPQQLQPLRPVSDLESPAAGAELWIGFQTDLGLVEAFELLFLSWSQPDRHLQGEPDDYACR